LDLNLARSSNPSYDRAPFRLSLNRETVLAKRGIVRFRLVAPQRTPPGLFGNSVACQRQRHSHNIYGIHSEIETLFDLPTHSWTHPLMGESIERMERKRNRNSIMVWCSHDDITRAMRFPMKEGRNRTWKNQHSIEPLWIRDLFPPSIFLPSGESIAPVQNAYYRQSQCNVYCNLADSWTKQRLGWFLSAVDLPVETATLLVTINAVEDETLVQSPPNHTINTKLFSHGLSIPK